MCFLSLNEIIFCCLLICFPPVNLNVYIFSNLWILACFTISLAHKCNWHFGFYFFFPLFSVSLPSLVPAFILRTYNIRGNLIIKQDPLALFLSHSLSVSPYIVHHNNKKSAYMHNITRVVRIVFDWKFDTSRIC